MQWLSEANSTTFDQEVLERSHEQLVVVDFWAAWCAPCHALAPILEAAVEARGGAVWLVKVDVDANQELAVQYGVRGIPAVKAFLRGQVVDEFAGVQDRMAVDAFLDRAAPSSGEQALHEAERLLAQQAPHKALDRALDPALKSPHHHDHALLLLARGHVSRGDVPAAQQALDAISKESLVADEARAMSLRIALYQAGDGDPSVLRAKVEETPEDAGDWWALAGAYYRRGQLDEALDTLLELLKRDRRFGDDQARRAMLALFEELGPDSDLAHQYRRQLQIYL